MSSGLLFINNFIDNNMQIVLLRKPEALKLCDVRHSILTANSTEIWYEDIGRWIDGIFFNLNKLIRKPICIISLE